MPIDTTDPMIINFLVETYNKTARLRMRWNELNENKLKQTATFRGPEKGYKEEDVAMGMVAEGLLTTTRDHIAAERYRKRVPLRDATFIPSTAHLRKGHSIPEVGLGDPKDDPRLSRPLTDLSPDPVMRPIPRKQKSIIYKGIPSFGREEYIKVRNRIKPEDKYYFQESRGWVYGWRLKDSFFGRHAPLYGRVAKLTQGRLSRTGPQPDPEYYKNPIAPGTICAPT